MWVFAILGRDWKGLMRVGVGKRKAGTVKGWPAGTVCVCLRCGHEWVTKNVGKPVWCAGCKGAKWDEAKKAIPHDPRPEGGKV